MKSRAPVGWLIGVLSAAVAVGVGEMVAAFVRPAASPVIAVGNKVILLTPESAKRAAIGSVGTNDKTVLIITILAALAIFGAFVGTLALANLYYGLGGIVVFGAFGVYSSLTANASRWTDAVPTVVGTLAAMGVMYALLHVVGAPPLQPATRRSGKNAASSERAGNDNIPAERPDPNPTSAQRRGIATPAAPLVADRRAFLAASTATAALAAVAGFGGRAAQRARFNVASARAAVKLPSAAKITNPLPPGVDLGKSGVPWATPNSDFYRIDTALTVPQIAPQSWSLRIHGMVDHPMTINYDDLLARRLIERWVTLCCVSNEVGGQLISNSLFRGALLADLLREAGLQSGADQLVLSSSDGMTIGAPAAVVMDGRDSMIAVGMNGQPLPVEHGFPARIVVPGLYGYVSACKWVVDIEATTFAARKAYWVQGGWDANPPIRLESRIDTPKSGSTVGIGKMVAIAGIAWDQHVGVSAVEVQVNDGRWQKARLAAVPSTDTWRQWVLPWVPAKSGSYQLRVRATDMSGMPQDDTNRSVFPSGASGLHTVTVQAIV